MGDLQQKLLDLVRRRELENVESDQILFAKLEQEQFIMFRDTVNIQAGEISRYLGNSTMVVNDNYKKSKYF